MAASNEALKAARDFFGNQPEALILALAEAFDAFASKRHPRAGTTLKKVLAWLPDDLDPWERATAVQEIDAPEKEISNALAYLVRKGHIRRMSYGRYRNVNREEAYLTAPIDAAGYIDFRPNRS